MSRSMLEPRQVAPRPLRRWVKTSFWFIAQAPLAWGALLGGLIALDSVFSVLTQDLRGTSWVAMQNAAIIGAAVVVPAVAALSVTIVQFVDRQLSADAVMRELKHNLRGAATPYVRVLSSIAISGVLFSYLTLGDIESNAQGSIMSICAFAALVSFAYWSTSGYAILMAPIRLGGCPESISDRAWREARRINRWDFAVTVLIQTVPLFLLAWVARLIDLSIGFHFSVPFVLILFSLVPYVAYRDIFEHEDGHRASESATYRRRLPTS